MVSRSQRERSTSAMRLPAHRRTGLMRRMRCAPFAASLLLHAAVVGGVLAFSCRARPFHMVVTWQPSVSSQPTEVQLQEPQTPVDEQDPPTPAVEPEDATAPPPETAMVTPSPLQFAPDKPPMEPVALALPQPQSPDWLCHVRPVQVAAAPPPAPAADFVDAVADASQNSPPIYPLESRRRAEQGAVVLELRIDAAGAVTDARVKLSSGHLRLDRAALLALRQWRFHPARRGGTAVAVSIDQTIEFQLTNLATAN
jgi:periplasmic protein TonB